MSERFNRREFIKLAGGCVFGGLIGDVLLGEDEISFSSLFDDTLPPIKIIPPYRGIFLNYVDRIIGGKLSAIITAPEKIAYRIADLLKDDIKKPASKLLGRVSSLEVNSGLKIHSFYINLEGIDDCFRILIADNNYRFQILSSLKTNQEDLLCLADMPENILKEKNNVLGAISIGATNPYFISNFSDGVWCRVPKNFLRNGYSFPFSPYVFLNYVGGLNNQKELDYFDKVQKKSPLSEYHHSDVFMIPDTGIFYQPQYGFVKQGNQIIFYGRNSFYHRWDQTVNLFGWTETAKKIFISGPWWFNQPDNQFVSQIAEEIFIRIGLNENYTLISGDTGGQTGFWFRSINNRINFSHRDNFNHTTALMLGLELVSF